MRADASRQYPAVILMCSFSPDVVDGCKVMEHGNIITLYHGKSFTNSDAYHTLTPSLEARARTCAARFTRAHEMGRQPRLQSVSRVRRGHRDVHGKLRLAA